MKWRMHMDISNTCTLACGECLRQKLLLKGQPPSMGGRNLSLKDFKKIADHAFDICINGQVSDPIFNPHLIEMLEYLNKVLPIEGKYSSTIYTAATTKKRKEDWYRRAFNACKEIQWFFGIDGLPEESCMYRENQDGEFLFEMMKMAVEMGNRTTWQYIVFNYNEHSIEEAKELAKKYNLNLQICKSSRWENIPYMKPSPEYVGNDL